MSFVKRVISVEITLTPTVRGGQIVQRTFQGQQDSNTVMLKGYRMSAHIVRAGGRAKGEMQLKIYGMSLSLMNQLSRIGKTPIFVDRNIITVYAGNEGETPSVAFSGNIQQAYTDLAGAPNSIFYISAYAGMFQALQTIPATTLKGSVYASDILNGLALQGNYNFHDYGVGKSVSLVNPNYSGSVDTQIKDVIQDAGICGEIFGTNLDIWPRGGQRGDQIPLVSADTGMVGYPFPSGEGLLGVKTLFNPYVGIGTLFKVESIIEPANGIWSALYVSHDLECEMPNGQWFSVIQGNPPKYFRAS